MLHAGHVHVDFFKASPRKNTPNRFFATPPASNRINKDMDEFLNELKDKFHVNKIAGVCSTNKSEHGEFAIIVRVYLNALYLMFFITN